MKNYIVPEFETDEDCDYPEMPKKSTMGGNQNIMELLWHNGQVVMQSQNQRSVGNKKPETKPSATREIRSSGVEEETVGPSDMFMQEDEMASWLHYPTDDNSLESYLYSNDLLYPTPPSSAPITAATASLTLPSSVPITAATTSLTPPPPPSVVIPSRPPVPPSRRVAVESGPQKCSNFLHFSRPILGVSPLSGSVSTSTITPSLRPSTVASNETPAAVAAPESRASRVSDIPETVSAGNVGGASTSGIFAAGTSSAGRELETCDVSVTSSPGTGGSGASASMDPPSSQIPTAPAEDRKRKGRDTDDAECHSEDVEFEYPDAKKQSHGGSTSTRRSRAAEVHNLSERRRRDRINEKMKALQELIPRCNKSDKASMLDEAIEYLKSLQMQIQMMSMGCSVVPVMFPGVQQYVPPMAMGMGMGMGIGMGMDMGMNRPMVPYPTILPGSSLPNPAAAAAAAHLGQRFPVPGFNMSPVTVAGPTGSQSAALSAPMMNPLPLNGQNQPRVPNFADPYQQYLGLHQTQLPQNQVGMPPTATKPSSSKDATNPDHHPTG